MDKDFTKFKEYIAKSSDKNFEDEENMIDGENQSDIAKLKIVKLMDENGVENEFYLLGSIEFQGKTYAFFQPAEEIDDVDADTVAVFETDGVNLAVVLDDNLLDQLFQEFNAEFVGEYLDEEVDYDDLDELIDLDGDLIN